MIQYNRVQVCACRKLYGMAGTIQIAAGNFLSVIVSCIYGCINDIPTYARHKRVSIPVIQRRYGRQGNGRKLVLVVFKLPVCAVITHDVHPIIDIFQFPACTSVSKHTLWITDGGM